jgi:hypothetical protein
VGLRDRLRALERLSEGEMVSIPQPGRPPAKVPRERAQKMRS